MGQKKLQRFAEINEFPNFLQYPLGMDGQWHHFFGNRNPISLELACGKGEYTIGLASIYAHHNFIGVDIKGNRIWAGAKKAIQEQLTNVAFLRTQIEQLPNYFANGEVQEIWITFPDPQLRVSRIRKRLTHPKFLRLYKRVLVNGGKIHIKTDSPHFFNFTKTVISVYGLNLIAEYEDLYSSRELSPELSIKTYYESLDIAGSNQIYYLCFSLPDCMPGDDTDIYLKSLFTTHEEVVQ